VRQLVSRSRNHVQARRPRFDPPTDAESIVLEFFAAASTGRVEPLLELLAPDVLLHTDGGGKKKAALNLIRGAGKVARFLAAVVPQAEDVQVELATVNGAPALLVHVDGELDTVGTVTTLDGKIQEVYLVRNPDKLGHAARAREIRIL
jgi:RNA polymerase sigma-70 factor (ECF subfamily)